MSVFIRSDAKDKTYSYDFRLRGRRFSGGTGRTTRREAEQVEEARRKEAAELMKLEAAAASPLPDLEAACARYWHEVGQHLANAPQRLWSLDWLLDHFGAAKPLHDIDDRDVASMVARRRGEFIPRRKVPRRVSNATVNRTVTEPLKDLMTRAQRVWKVPVKPIDWKLHLLAEPRERVREASAGEEASIMAELERGYEDALRFAILSGCRRAEILGLEWSRVDFFGRQFTVIGKGDRKRVIPMSQELFELLWAQRGHHDKAVFTYEAKRTLRVAGVARLVRGRRYPLTEAGLKSAARRAIARSGTEDFRFHDTRHTAATRVLRKSNLLVVQKLLGHADPSTTAKYAHVMQEDIRAALDAASAGDAAPYSTEELDAAAKWLTSLRKVR